MSGADFGCAGASARCALRVICTAAFSMEEGNLLDLGNFRLNVIACAGPYLGLFDQEKGLLFAADTLMPGGVMGALRRSQALLSDTGQLFDALDARSNFEPIMQSARDLNQLDD